MAAKRVRAQHKRRGRPRVSDRDSLLSAARFDIRMTKAQKEAYQVGAQADGYTLADWFRWLGDTRLKELGL